MVSTRLIRLAAKKKKNNLVPTFVCGVVRDCAAVHVAAYANPSASGRYMCLDESIHWNQLADILAKVYPKFPGTQGVGASTDSGLPMLIVQCCPRYDAV